MWNLITIKISRLQDAQRHTCCIDKKLINIKKISQSCISGTFRKADSGLYDLALPNTVSSISTYFIYQEPSKEL